MQQDSVEFQHRADRTLSSAQMSDEMMIYDAWTCEGRLTRADEWGVFFSRSRRLQVKKTHE